MEEIVEAVGELIGDAAVGSMTSRNNNGCGPIILVIVIITIVVVGIFYLFNIKEFKIKKNQEAIEQIVREYKEYNPPNSLTESKGSQVGPVDLFGSEVLLTYEVLSDRVNYTCLSSGIDRKLETNEDNQISTVSDLNKSKIAGKWIATKTKEFGKGLKEGLFPKKEEVNDAH